MGFAEFFAACCVGCGGCILVLILLAFGLSTLGFAIAGSVILAQTSEIIHGPYNVWIYVLVEVIILYILALGLFRDKYTTVKEDENGNKSKITVSQTSGIISLGALGVAIWGMVIYYNMDDVTHAMYMTSYPSLILYLQAIVTYFIICWSLLGLFLVLACCGICFGSSRRSTNNFNIDF
jgi:hypothetical protein